MAPASHDGVTTRANGWRRTSPPPPDARAPTAGAGAATSGAGAADREVGTRADAQTPQPATWDLQGEAVGSGGEEGRAVGPVSAGVHVGAGDEAPVGGEPGDRQ